MKTTRFAFDTVFDASGQVLQESARKPVKKAYTPEEVEAIRKDAYAEGAGGAEAKAMNAVALAVGQIVNAVMQIIGALDDEIIRLRKEAATIALTAAKRIAGAALAAHPIEEVERLLSECLDTLPTEPRLVVRVAPALVEELKPRIDALATDRGFAGRVVIVADNDVRGADARIEWSTGGLETSAERVENEIEATTANYLAGLGVEDAPQTR